MMQKLVLLSIGGAAGTLARYGLAGLVHRLHSEPVGTLVVNALGCLIFGLICGLTEHRLSPGPFVSLALLAGFCAAFTTFSTYAFDTSQLARHAGLLRTGTYVLAQNVIGIASVFLGVWAGRLCNSVPG